MGIKGQGRGAAFSSHQYPAEKCNARFYKIYKIRKPREMLSDVKINLTVDSANNRYDVK